MEKAQADVLNWAVNAPRTERMEFLKSFLDTLSYDEVKVGAMQLTKKAKRRKMSSARGATGGAALPSSSSAVPSSLAPKPWWQKFKKSEIVAMDCEMVQKVAGMRGKKKRCVQILASVVVVNFFGETIYKQTVKRPTGSYYVTPTTTKINGITSSSLAEGAAEFSEVQKEVQELIHDKLIITLMGKSDFDALEITPVNDYSTFDIQHHWYRQKVNEDGVMVTEVMGLKEIYAMYFGEPIQVEVHSPEEDAKATMRIFRDVYVKIKVEDVDSKHNNTPFE